MISDEFKIERKTVCIFGTEYTIIVRKYEEDETFECYNANGYCRVPEKEIVLCDMRTYPGWENESEKAVELQMEMNMKHYIVHAFLRESCFPFIRKQWDELNG